MSRQKPVLWATSKLEPYEVRIFKKRMKNHDGYAQETAKYRFDVYLNPRIFENDFLLWNTLFHEFCHLVEMCFTPGEWKEKQIRRNLCAPYIDELGKGLAELMLNLRFVESQPANSSPSTQT